MKNKEFNIRSDGYDIKIQVFNPVSRWQEPHNLVWKIHFDDFIWYHSFALMIEGGVNVPAMMMNTAKALLNRKFSWEFNPTATNKEEMLMTYANVLDKFDITRLDMVNIRRELKKHEIKVYRHEYKVREVYKTKEKEPEHWKCVDVVEGIKV